MKYRDYQIEVAQIAVNCLTVSPSSKQLLVLPTGAGKSITIRKIVEDLVEAGLGPLLIAVHKRELVAQLSETMSKARTSRGPVRVVVERAEEIGLQEARGQYDVAVCSIQTLQRRPEVLDDENIGVVFIDETHRALAEGYLEVLGRLGVGTPHGPGLLGFTATAFRGTGDDLTALYETVAYKRDLVDFMRDAWLVPIKAKRVFVRETAAEDGGVVDRVTSDDDLFEQVYDTFREHCMNKTGKRVLRPTLMMTQSVDQGIALEASLQDRGVNARMVYGAMPDALRDQYVNDFRSGALDVLLGFNILIEGFDAPRASAMFWLRNTTSPVTFMQGLGRITRPYFGDDELFSEFNAQTEVEARAQAIQQSAKPDALFFDFTDITARFDVVTLGTAFGMAKDFDFEGEDVLDVYEQVQAVAEAYQILDTDSIESVTDIARVSEDAELWRQAVTPNMGVPENAQLGGYAKRGGSWVCFFSEMDENITWSLRISQNALGEYTAEIGQPEIWMTWYYNPREKKHALKYYRQRGQPPHGETVTIYGPGGAREVPRYVKVSGLPYSEIARDTSLDEVFYLAESYVYSNFSKRLWEFKHKDAAWRSKPVSPKLARGLEAVKRAGVPLPDALDNGTASDIYKLHLLGLLTVPKLAKKRRRRPVKVVA